MCEVTERQDARDPASAGPAIPVQDPRVAEVLAWWQGARAGQPLPTRDEIEPLAFVRTLPLVWLSQYDPRAETFRFCLAGEEVRANLGVPLRGRSLEAVFPSARLPHIRAVYSRVVATPAAYHRQGRIYSSMGRVGTGERLMLPLTDRQGQAACVLGVTAYVLNVPQPGDGSDQIGFDASAPPARFYPVEGAAPFS